MVAHDTRLLVLIGRAPWPKFDAFDTMYQLQKFTHPAHRNNAGDYQIADELGCVVKHNKVA
jgi:hypothetical protein